MAKNVMNYALAVDSKVSKHKLQNVTVQANINATLPHVCCTCTQFLADMRLYKQVNNV